MSSLRGKSAVVDPALTHIQLVVADAGNTAMLYACTAVEAQRSIDEWKDPESRAFTIIADNGSRYTFNAERVLLVEQISVEVAAERLKAYADAKAQSEASAARGGGSPLVGVRGAIPRA